MAISFFEAESVGNGSLPFANEYLDENPRENGKVYTINEFKLVNSGKGYLFTTDKFSGFLFKNQKTAKQIVEALEHYIKQYHGFALVAKLDKSVKGAIVIGVDGDTPVTWHQLGNGFTTLEPSVDSPTLGGNPFILPVPSTPSGVSTTTQTATPITSASKKRA